MPRTIHAQLVIANQGNNSVPALVKAVCVYLQSKGFKVAEPHLYPDEPIIIEITEEIPQLQY